MDNVPTEQECTDILIASMDQTNSILNHWADMLQLKAECVPEKVNSAELMLAHTVVLNTIVMLRLMTNPEHTPVMMNAMAVCMRRIAKTPEDRRKIAKAVSGLDEMADALRRL